MLLDALFCKNNLKVPVWLMRQAGRYMPQYKAYKSSKELLSLFRDTQAIVEITKLPLDLLEVDAAIVFSDILIILEAFSIDYTFEDKIGPKIKQDVGLKHLQSFDLSALDFLFDAMKILNSEIKVPLIGFAGAPFTIASYLIEGGSSKDYKKIKKYLYQDPQGFYKMLDFLSIAIARFLDRQVESGAKALQLFDSWANIMPYDHFQIYSLGFLKKIISLRRYKDVPLIYFSKASGMYLEEISACGVSCISLDMSSDISRARQRVGSSIALQGNLDPQAFYGSKQFLKSEVNKILDKMRGDKGFIFNLGHGIPPDAPFDNVKYVVELVKCQT
jgi:uroporphyrinogen decarboxylase